ncbi:MAG: hypothetical protein M9894_39140 [Planctomycetes bacterium]|nr:hypothetical protein [Planctomycetota bacterium]
MSWRGRLDGALTGVWMLFVAAFAGGGVGFAATVMMVDKRWSTESDTAQGLAPCVGLLLALLTTGALGHEMAGGRRGVARAWAVVVFAGVAAAGAATSPLTSTPLATPLAALGAAALGGAALLAPPRGAAAGPG